LREAASATDVAEVQSPREDAFTRNDPNPFVSRTQIRFAVENDGPVSLRIYDVRGREVETLVDGFRTSGVHAVDWDAKDRPSGVYFYRLAAGDSEETRKKMVLLR
jgi:serine protease AprX